MTVQLSSPPSIISAWSQVPPLRLRLAPRYRQLHHHQQKLGLRVRCFPGLRHLPAHQVELRPQPVQQRTQAIAKPPGGDHVVDVARVLVHAQMT